MPVTRVPGAGLARRIGRRRAWLTWRAPHDRGAVAVLFSVLLGGGVLLGMLALVVDVGQIYAERNDLQNGADAAALAIAKACSADPAPQCQNYEALQGIAQHFADSNAADGKSHVEQVCGRLASGLLPSCQDGPAQMCLGGQPSEDYVEVRLSTELADGSFVLPPTFSQTMAGGRNSGTTVGACARAVWGPRPLHILAITVSICEFIDDTSYDPQTHEGDWGSQSSPRTQDERVINLWYPLPPHGTCSASQTADGWGAPGPAAILAGASSSCQIGIDGDGVVSGTYVTSWQPYATAYEPCENRMDSVRWVSNANRGDVIYLPVHDGVNPEGTSFHHLWVAPFLVTAYQFGSPPSANPPYDPAEHRVGSALLGSPYTATNTSSPCGTPAVGYRCLTGIFLGQPISVDALTNNARIRLVG